MLSVSANHLFLQFPSEVREALLPHLKLEEFVRGQIVVDERLPVEKVSFPISTLLVSEAPMGNDRYAFTGLLGRHNIVGSHRFHAQPFPDRKVTVIVTGLAATCPIEVFHHCYSEFESLRVVISWVQTQGHRRVAQLAACSTTHNLTERLARLLLSLKYLQGLDTIPVAHRDLAHILGVRREAISRELTLAEASGALQLQRRCIAITDENLLAARSCRCHEEMRFSGRYDYSALAAMLQSLS